jgi:toxin ParE1/3/4
VTPELPSAGAADLPARPVVWTTEAMTQLKDIHDYIARRSPQYARRVVDRVTRRSQQIARYPMAGVAVPEVAMPQLRQVVEGPYRMIYHLLPDRNRDHCPVSRGQAKSVDRLRMVRRG